MAPIIQMLKDMRQLRDSLQFSLVAGDNAAIRSRVVELTAQIAAIEALQDDALRYRALRTLAMESDPDKQAAIDAAMDRAMLSSQYDAASLDEALDSVLESLQCKP